MHWQKASLRNWALILVGILIVGAILVRVSLAAPPAEKARALRSLSGDLPPYAAGRLLVAFEPAVKAEQRAAILSERALVVLKHIKDIGVDVVAVPEGQEIAMAKELMKRPAVRYAELDYQVRAFRTPNDPSFASRQWNMTKINGPAAWDVSIGSASSIIAIIDTGIDLTHPDLASKIVPGYDFVNDDSTAQDDNGHGTHCAGIAAAATDNGVGVAGVNWLARLMPVKVLDSEGSGWTSDVIEGLLWAADHGANVISMSLGGGSYSISFQDAINTAYSRGVVIVAAAGNEYEEGNPVSYPAAYDHVIGVAATGANDEHAWYSNTGSYVDVAAPGGNSRQGSSIYSTYWQSGSHTYANLQGTSMACPHVAGLAALVQAVNPALTPGEVEWVIESTAVDLGLPGRDNVFGWGRIDAAAAVRAAPDPPPTPTPTATPTGDAYEPDNSCAEAREFPVDGPAQTHDFHIPTDVDWVKFTAVAGAFYTIETSNLGSNADTYMYLYRPDCSTVIAEDDDSGPGLGSRIEWTADANGTFYVMIRPYSASRTGPESNYDLTITRSTPPQGDAYEPDNSCAEAREFPVDGPAQTHDFHIPTDVDWVKFTATVGNRYVLETSNLGENADTVMYLYRPDCSTEITHDDDNGPGLGSRIEWTADANGTFYAMIRPYSASRTGAGSNYDLTINRVAVAPQVSPASLSATLPQGGSSSQTLTLRNPGASPITFSIVDMEISRPTLASSWVEMLPTPAPSVGARNKAGKAPESAAYRYHGSLSVPRILVYTDDAVLSAGTTYVEQALRRIGLSYTGHYADCTGFGSNLAAAGWDVVLVSHNNQFCLGNYWEELRAYLNAGGKAVIETFDLDGSDSETTTLWSTLGIAPAGDLSAPAPVYRWVSADRLFTVPYSIPNFTNLEEGYMDDGDRASVSGAAVAKAGFTATSQSGQAGIIVALGGRAIVDSWIVSEARGDEDSDGVLDAVELWTNQISYVTGIGGDAAWLTENPTSGTLPAGGSTPINVSFNATGLAAGEYHANILIGHNGNAINPLVVPVTLTVTGTLPSTIVSVQPPEKRVGLTGGPFTITVAISDVANLGGFQFDLTYNQGIISPTQVILGPFLGSTGRTTAPVGPTYSAGRLSFGGFAFGAQPGPSGSGVLAIVTFVPVAEGSSLVTLENVTVTDTAAQIIPVTTAGGQVVVRRCPYDFDGDGDVDIVDIMLVASRWNCRCGDACYDARYDMDSDCDIDIVDIMRVAAAWGTICGAVTEEEAPAALEVTPILSVAPAAQTVRAGDTFTLSVLIEETSNLGAFEFSVRYDPTVVTATQAILGPFLGSTGRITVPMGPTFKSDRITFGAFSYGGQLGPSGNGTLATLTFTALAPGSSVLDLTDVQVTDASGFPQIPSSVKDGSVDVIAPQNRLYLPFLLRNR